MKRGVAGLLLAALASLAQAQESLKESPKDIIAAHLRIEGYQCDAPKSAQRDARASRPDEQVWLIVCENARYRVRLVPDMRDVVEPY
jgi:hypothetical protein